MNDRARDRDYITGQTYKATFFHIEKTGGHSIKRVFEAYPELLYFQGSTTVHYHPKSFVATHGWTNFAKLGTTFICVRNPYTRVVSYYEYCQRRESHPWHKIAKNLSLEDWIVRQARGIEHQHTYLGYVDRVLRFERLEQDFFCLMTELGYDVKLPRVNANPSPKYEKHLTTEVKELIADYWKQDFQELGYEF